MTSNENTDNVPEQLSSEIPVALVDSNRLTFGDIFRGSYMWLVALICLIVAIGIAWWSMPEQGIQITIHFPEGHGLKSEDVVRFRGIDVGVVEEVKLNRELDGVDVHVNLQPFAEPLAREGTQFWIVRPELSLAGISGLETAVGHKYIGLIPGDPDANWKEVFEGLPNSPPDALEQQGVEIILRGDRRQSLTPGSPVSYRGVEIGRILSVAISGDGRYVDARAKIFDKYAIYITSESKFWPSSGIDVEVSMMSGMKLNTESVETLLRGGVATLTIAEGGKPISSGQVFELSSRAGDDWYELAQKVRATDVALRGAYPVSITWKQKSLFRTVTENQTCSGTLVNIDGRSSILVPTDKLSIPEEALEGTFQIKVGEQALDLDLAEQSGEVLSLLPLPGELRLPNEIEASEFRTMETPERCIATFANTDNTETRYFHLPIEAENIGEGMTLKNFDGDASVWHGAPVLAVRDGSLIGVLLVQDNLAKIVPVASK